MTGMESYIHVTKLALAMAIIRTKPSGMTGKQHAAALCGQMQTAQLNWKAKCESLQQEVLMLKQDLLQNELSIAKETVNDVGKGFTFIIG